MSSLRVRQKRARSKKIIEAARNLFLEHGYSKTNMDAIADAAEVGVATIYTYFDNKEGVATALIRKDMSKVWAQAEEQLKCLPDDPVEAVIILLDIYKKFDDYISHAMMQDFIIQAKTKGPVRDTVNWAHELQVEQITKALEQGQKAGTVSQSLSTDLAAGIIIDLLDRHINRISSDSGSPHDHDDLDKYIRILFNNWRS
jgi:AcrR family transcriptional regulator